MKTDEQPSSNTYQEPKMWEDLTLEEKIERCRETINNWGSRVARVERDIELFRRLLAEHRHDTTGEVLQKIVPRSDHALNLVGDSLKRSDGKSYF